MPIVEEFNSPVWHLFCIRSSNRDNLRQELLNKGVETLIHYPIPPHKQLAYKKYNNLSFPITEKIHRQVLSLPLSGVIESFEVKQIIKILNDY